MTLTSSSPNVAERHSPIGTAARLDDVISLQVEKSVLHDATMTAIAMKVLTALDLNVSWEQAPGAETLKALMPEFRRACNFGLLDPRYCPECDSQFEEYDEPDGNGALRVVFQCDNGHIYRGRYDGIAWLPDFSTWEAGS
jgi:hypothetical protein